MTSHGFFFIYFKTVSICATRRRSGRPVRYLSRPICDPPARGAARPGAPPAPARPGARGAGASALTACSPQPRRAAGTRTRCAAASRTPPQVASRRPRRRRRRRDLRFVRPVLSLGSLPVPRPAPACAPPAPPAPRPLVASGRRARRPARAPARHCRRPRSPVPRRRGPRRLTACRILIH